MPKLITIFWVRNDKYRAVETNDQYDYERDLIIERCEEDAMGQERWVTREIVESDAVKNLILTLASRPTPDMIRKASFETDADDTDQLLSSLS